MLDIIHCGHHTLLTAVNNPLNITKDWFVPDYWQHKNAIIAEKKAALPHGFSIIPME